MITENLKISLKESNNFNYFITGSVDGKKFTIKAVLRADSWGECNNTTESVRCKQKDTKDIDTWVSDFTRDENKHFLIYESDETKHHTDDKDYVEHGINYKDLYTGE